MTRNKANTDDIKNYIKVLSEIEIPTKNIKEIMTSLDYFSNAIKKSTEPIDKVTQSISKAAKQYEEITKPITEVVIESIPSYKELKKLINSINEKYTVKTDLINKLAKDNNGIVTNRMIEPLNISREYLTYLKNNEELEKVGRGIYQLKDNIDDKYYEIAYKYKKAVFSHMCALNLYGLTEQIPYKYTVTVPSGYHIDGRSINCKIYYVKKDIYKLGLTRTQSPTGTFVKAYDIERCICDIIKSKKIDPEQVKKSVKEYLKRKDKDLNKLSEYSKKLNCYEKVMEYIGLLNE